MSARVEREAIITPRGDGFDYVLPRWNLSGHRRGSRAELVEKIDKMLRRHSGSSLSWRTMPIKGDD